MFEPWFLAYCFFTVSFCNQLWCIATVIHIPGPVLCLLAWDPVCRELRYFSLIYCHQTGALDPVVIAAQLICCHCVIPRTSREKSLSCWARGVSSILEESSVPSHGLCVFFWHLEELFAPSGLGVCNWGSLVWAVLSAEDRALTCLLSVQDSMWGVFQFSEVALHFALSGIKWLLWPIPIPSLIVQYYLVSSLLVSMLPHELVFLCLLLFLQSSEVIPFKMQSWTSIFLWSGTNYISGLNVCQVCHSRDGGQLLVILQLKLNYIIFLYPE